MSRNIASKSPPAAAPGSSDRAARAAAREQQMALAARAAATVDHHHPHKPALSRQAGPAPASAASSAAASAAAAAPASPVRTPAAAASSASAAPPASASSSSSSSAPSLTAVGGALPSTSAPCTHRGAAAHLVLPHQSSQREFWNGVVLAKLAPLAKYYRANVATAARPVAPAASAAAASSSSSAAAAAALQDDNDPDVQMAAASQQPEDSIDEEEGETVSAGAGPSGRSRNNNGSKSKGPPRLWGRFEVTDAISAPISNISAAVALLKSVRHPASQSGAFTGKSLAHTLADVMHPADTQHFLRVLLPFLAHLVLRLPELFPEGSTCLPLMVTGVEATVTLSAAQCACLLACQFFSLFGPKASDADAEIHPRDSTWPSCNMDAFFSVQRSPMSGKHMMLFNYFARIENPAEGISQGRFVSFHRRVLPQPMINLVADDAKLSSSTVPLSAAVYREEGCIEDAAHSLQVDFANRYIGGGVLYTGCVQEEIRFCLSPECLVSMALAERLEEAESLILLGPKMYSHYAGYGTSLVFGADCADEGLEPDEFGRLSNSIVAIDAIDFEHNDGSDEDGLTTASQWRADLMARETLKAFVGFSVPQAVMGSKFQYDSVATGNWGCGAFGGFVPLKFLLQWLSSSLAGRSLIYYSFANPLAQSIPLFVQAINKEFGTAAVTAAAAAATQAPVKWGSGATGTPPPPLAAAAAAAAAFSSSSGQSSVTVGEMWRALKVVAPRWSRARESDIKNNHDGLFADLIKAIKQARGKAKF